MIISMFDKSVLQKKLLYFGDKHEPHLLVRNKKAMVSAYIRQKNAWMFDEPDRECGELRAVEGWYNDFRDLHNNNQQAIFNAELIEVSDDIAFLVALSQFRRCVVLGIDPTNSNLHKLREYICDGPDGIDDLLDMRPYEPPALKEVAEYDAVINGQKISGVVKE